MRPDEPALKKHVAWGGAFLAVLTLGLASMTVGVRPSEASILADKKAEKKKAKTAGGRSDSTEQGASSAKAPSRFRAVVIADFGSNLFPVGTEQYSAGSSLLLIPSYQLSSDWSVGLLASAYKEVTDLREFTLFDPSLRISYRAIPLSPTVSVAPALWAALPVSERSRERDSLIVSVRPALRFAADFSKSKLPVIQHSSVSWETGIARAFHQYSNSTTGAVNTAWRLSNWFNLYYGPGEKWFLSGDFIRNTGWSYQGVGRHSFSMGQTVGYRFTPSLTLSVGHTNEGDVLRANGLTSNIAIFDSTTSRVFTSLMVIF